MSQMTNYLENRLIDLIFRNQAFAAPATLHIALHTADPTDTGAVGEVASANGYARASLASSLANWNSTQGGAGSASTGTTGNTTNAAAINFPTPTGAGWGTVTHFSIWDAASGGNCLIYGPLGVSKTINPGDAVSVAIGALSVTFA